MIQVLIICFEYSRRGCVLGEERLTANVIIQSRPSPLGGGLFEPTQNLDETWYSNLRDKNFSDS